MATEEVKIADLKPYHKNPRKMKDEDYKLLAESLQEFGDLSGIVVNRTTGELVGGNQRTNFFKQFPDEVKVVVLERFENPSSTGTTAVGHVLFKGERFSFREVAWDGKKEERANIIANKVSGEWDFDMLANAFDVDVLLSSGWKSFELGFATSREQSGTDDNPLGGSAETYLAGKVKQITLYFSADEFEKVMPRMDKAMAEFDVTSHTEVVLKLLDEHESN